jgi:hypothetical protein
MRTVITTLTLAITLSLGAGLTGCGGDSDGPSCEKVTDHFLSLADEQTKKMLGDKSKMIEKCKKDLTAEDRKCALDAKDMAGIMKCSAAAKKRKQS